MTVGGLAARPRSILCVPGGNPVMMAKAMASAADRVLIDLEDAVDRAQKKAARQSVVEYIESLEPIDAQRVSVRINAPGAGWAIADLLAIVHATRRVQSIVLPKVDTAADLAFASRLLDDAEAGAAETLLLEALIEGASGLGALRRGELGSPRLAALIVGYADLGASLGRGALVGFGTWQPAQHDVLVAARERHWLAFDGPHLSVAVDDEFLAEARHAASFGFDGKWVIHPRQIEAVNEAFTPSDRAAEWASGVIASLEAAAERGAGAVDFEGQMVDEAVAVMARQLLERKAAVS